MTNQDQISIKPYFKLLVWAIPLLIIVALIGHYSPATTKAPEGFSSTIVAFEFANTLEKLNLTLDQLTESEIKGLDNLNTVDYVFMVFYGSLLFLFLLVSNRLLKQGYLKVAMILPILIVLFDVFENGQMFKLTDWYLSKASFGDQQMEMLNQLQIYTQIKWALLSITFGLIATVVWRNGGRLKYASILFLFPMVLMLLSLLNGSNTSIDFYTASIFQSFLFLFLYMGFYKRENVEDT